ncbi:NADPH-dependent ferric siderophore reductase, contains FAD-binding and SIP domains [Gordonia malaquae]|uniref:Putative siderophore-interacting protein n=1 Tax=Gordonia malaquae NBRC 108250 TaxID=1223542 RepID=M3V9Y0_GORML|nr:siderophore-interacting protein [Gordonia malaquae]GAC78348.1 putative siderophore-interacting protein [Gordonia malaquae NBRC 108250]SED32677.1 NADPH-dependent ferric siderophore reductase, contains FAD-binding and SIP domains [Gordonia malaquae]
MADGRVYAATVGAVADLTPRMRRLTLRAPELAGFVPSGPDEYIGLLMPTTADQPLMLPSLDDGPNIRAAVSAMDDDVRPDLRWYTVRAHRPQMCEVDVDVVVHGDQGPGTRFARRARIGTAVGIRESTAMYSSAVSPVSRLLVGDETALPAIARILETTPSSPTRVLIEVGTASDRVAVDSATSIEWIVRGSRVPGAALDEALRAASVPSDVGLVWLCGERSAIRRMRRHLVEDRGVGRERILFSGYWRLGEARG